MKNISALIIVFTSTTTLCARDKELDHINQLLDHALYEDATFKAIDIYNKSQSDDDKAECLYLLHELAKKRKLSETAKEEKRKLLLYFPNSTFAQKVIAKDQENINAALKSYLSKEIDISTSWNFFGIKSGMTKAEVDKVLFPRLKMLNIRITDDTEYYKNDKLYKYNVTLTINSEAYEKTDVFSARFSSFLIALKLMYANADISYSTGHGSWTIELNFTDDNVQSELASEKLKEATDVLFATDVEIKEIQEEERRKKEEEILKKEEEEQRKKDEIERLRIAREKEEQEKKEKAFLASIFVGYEKPENLDALTKAEVNANIDNIELGFKKYNEIAKNFPSQISLSIESKVNEIRSIFTELEKMREELK